jgi:hypothetical protein
MICSAQEEPPSEENLMRMNLVKYCTVVKQKNELKIVPRRAPNY